MTSTTSPATRPTRAPHVCAYSVKTARCFTCSAPRPEAQEADYVATWSSAGDGNTIRTDRVNLRNARERGLEDHEATRRILAIAKLYDLARADDITIHTLTPATQETR